MDRSILCVDAINRKHIHRAYCTRILEDIEYCFQHEKIIVISSSYRVMFFLLYGQKSEQANREP